MVLGFTGWNFLHCLARRACRVYKPCFSKKKKAGGGWGMYVCGALQQANHHLIMDSQNPFFFKQLTESWNRMDP